MIAHLMAYPVRRKVACCSADTTIVGLTDLERYPGMKTKTPTGPRDEVVNRQKKSYARRDARGRFTEITDEGRSLSQDRRKHAAHKKPPRQGDRGD